MAIDNASLKVGATSVAATPTGGTSANLLSLSDDGTSRVCQVGTGSYLDSTNITFKVTLPKQSSSAPAGYTQQRCNVTIKRPLSLDNGAKTVNTVRFESSTDPESTVAEINELRYLMAQIALGSAFDTFWESLSIS